MTSRWQTLAHAERRQGRLELRRRSSDEFLITLAGRVLMNSRARRSEVALGEQGCAHLRGRSGARVLVGGLGMGITLRAVLDALPADAEVVVAELDAAVAEWCAGALAELNGHALADPRVRLQLADVARVIEQASRGRDGVRFDAILLDLYEGPHAATPAWDDPFYGRSALARSRAALRAGGVLAVWSEQSDRGFEKRLQGAGFAVRRSRPGRGGLRHAVYRATRGGADPGRAELR